MFYCFYDSTGLCLHVPDRRHMQLLTLICLGSAKMNKITSHIVRRPRELNALQLQKTRANRKSTSKSRKHLHQFDSRCCKCTQHNQIKNFICSMFLCLVVLWAFVVRVLSNWWSCFLNLQVLFLFAACWAVSATIILCLQMKITLY